ncbi:MAG: hypothetical protein O7B30_03955, partial [Thaumarchaeota archaeon]|nr:hypothetical protein [Nitrososphaerota archaeon]
MVWFLIRSNQISARENLNTFLQTGFLSKKLGNSQIFYEFITSIKPADRVVDFGKAREAHFLDSIREEIRGELRKEMSEDKILDVEEEIRKKVAEYESIPSVLDSTEYEEPALLQEDSNSEIVIPWWQQLNLTADPFPTTEGLMRIDPKEYEGVVVKTPLFEKYSSYLEVAKDEIFKNTIFFGEFGSGKTTLF